MKVLDLFSGIGGFSVGLEAAGMETVAFCEIEEYPQKVLKKHWPDVPIYNDVRSLDNEQLKSDGITGIEVLVGGFPCQDISVAGNQAGISEETRSGLWSECARLLGDIRPKYAIFENVTALLNGAGGYWFKRVLWEISEVGYDAEWHCIPASELGAHHHRDRIWIIAYPSSSSIRANAGTQPRTERERKKLQQENREALSNDIRSACKNIPTNPKHNGHSTESELRSNETPSDNWGQKGAKVSGESERENRSINVSSIRGSDSRGVQRHSETGRNSSQEKTILPDTENDRRNRGSIDEKESSGNSESATKGSSVLADTISKRQQGQGQYEQSLFTKAYGEGKSINALPGGSPELWKTESKLGRVANGVPNGSHRLKCLGNAVVPQIPELIGRAIMAAEYGEQ
ncbi:MAG: DNA (cytosine-5-)-methyltransferase [Gammaproteobacteria bacterium]|nr:DNA (cytosine-5-)-methyltransferase [Gammaproteobacteria bacterium]